MPDIQSIAWNLRTLSALSRHDVSPSEVESVTRRKPLVLLAPGERLVVVGPTDVGRILILVLIPEDKGVYRIITARNANRNEKVLYERSSQELDG